MRERYAPREDGANMKSNKALTTVIYALQAASFIVGITFIVAVIVNYVKRSDVEGTWLMSHFRWQIRTFWFSVLWSVVGYLTLLLLVGYLILLADIIWVVYRIVKGWINLADNKPMYE